MTIDYFRSSDVSWPRGVHLTRSTWHSAMQWGWPSINRGEHLARWQHYFTLSVCVGRRGVSWQWWPYPEEWRRVVSGEKPLLRARYDSHCDGCNLPISVGQPIAKMSDETYRHESCSS